VNLWGLLQDVQLGDRPDSIRWKWTLNGLYSSKSAYTVQFRKSFCMFDSRSLWRAQTEGKHRLFGWLLIRSKILTADKFLARNWLCDPLWSMCDQHQESAAHLCLHCVFAQEVWTFASV
jgi:hypothetical protein